MLPESCGKPATNSLNSTRLIPCLAKIPTGVVIAVAVQDVVVVEGVVEPVGMLVVGMTVVAVPGSGDELVSPPKKLKISPSAHTVKNVVNE